MIITTTPSIEGRRIVDYRGIVFGEVVSGVDFVRDLAASFTNFFGGRSGGYEEELVTARQNALNEMAQRAASAGANAVVGVDVDYEVLGEVSALILNYIAKGASRNARRKAVDPCGSEFPGYPSSDGSGN